MQRLADRRVAPQVLGAAVHGVAAEDAHRSGGGREHPEDHAPGDGAREPQQVEQEQPERVLPQAGVPADDAAHQPFTEPIMTPFSKYFWMKG